MEASKAVLAHHFHDMPQQREAQLAGMWVFLATEVLVFGALFTGYTAYRTLYPGAFVAASGRLNLPIAAANTIVLLTSSLSMVLSLHATRTGRRRMQVICLVLTALLGTMFMVLKAVEYTKDYHEHLVPGTAAFDPPAFDPQEWAAAGVNPRQVQLFLMFYYIMTGLHALHLIDRHRPDRRASRPGLRGGDSRRPITCRSRWQGSIWHFVDVVWIFLLPLLYLVGTRALTRGTSAAAKQCACPCPR